jgi:uncharacterized membrane protein YozB (DUF420 family)/desulfoferrodoxin (superoxide reductase-like protein)
VRRPAVSAIAATALMVLLVASSLPTAAHPPEEMTVVFNDRMDVLTVTLKHDVKDKTTHYVEKIEVYWNSALVIERVFESQPRDSYAERFSLEAEEGDVVLVKACCNIEGCVERELEVGPGVSAEGDRAGTIGTVIVGHAIIQIVALVLALVAIPGGMHFFRAWRNKTKPTGKRRRHIRIGGTAAAMWGLGSLLGFWIVYMTSGDYLGSIHGWLALATFATALMAGYSASPRFRKAGYGMRMQAHMPLSLLAIIIAIITIVCGMLTAGFI